MILVFFYGVSSLLHIKTKDGKLTVLKKNGDMLLWFDDVDKDLMKGQIGNRGMSLAYLNIDKKAPDANTDNTLWDFEQGKCYSKEHGSLKQELIHRSTQDHPNTNDNNNLLYRLLDTATKNRCSILAKTAVKVFTARGSFLKISRQLLFFHISTRRW